MYGLVTTCMKVVQLVWSSLNLYEGVATCMEVFQLVWKSFVVHCVVLRLSCRFARAILDIASGDIIWSISATKNEKSGLVAQVTSQKMIYKQVHEDEKTCVSPSEELACICLAYGHA